MTNNESSPQLPLVLKDESAFESSIGISASEAEALDSERASQIQNFNEDGLVVLRAKQLPSAYQFSKDTAPLLLPLDKMRIYPGLNPRLPSAEWKAHIESLAESMMDLGFLAHKPLFGFASQEDGKKIIFIADGESRFHAAHLAIERGAKIDEVPIILAPDGTSVEDIVKNLAPSNRGRDFTPLEKALHAQRLVRHYRMTNQEVARNLNVTAEYVSQLLTLASAPAKVRQMVLDGKVPADLAIQTMRGPNPETAVSTLQAAVENAEKAGKSKATRKHMPDFAIKRAVSKRSSDLHAVVTRFQALPQYKTLDADFQSEIEALLEAIKADADGKKDKPEKPTKAAASKEDKPKGKAPVPAKKVAAAGQAKPKRTAGKAS
ncbi:ParB/RepB/Spo0J family partition protein [Comamonas testosteroni]|uniref:ParB/RepB/Spo0J family partition protein n=1 Tax=Comamonas testosteroni TaxID=285 RepID=UPI000A6B5F86|nr:ParB/RepB/Spo0J family partition protein [Comamonas testosteroni]